MYKRSHSNRICFSLFIITIVLLFFSSASVVAAAPTLNWELVNPFSFIRDRGVIDVLRKEHEKISKDSKKPILDLEQALQIADEARVTRDRERAQSCQAIKEGAERLNCLKELKLSYLGWFSDLAENNYMKTCWDAETLRFRDEDEDAARGFSSCKNYLNPTRHKIRVWIDDSTVPGDTQLLWYRDNEIVRVEDCADKIGKPFCVELEIQNKAGEIKVNTLSGTPVAPPRTIKIKDKLIVGLGDSYASGEGNPDKPVEFRQNRNEPDFLYPLGFRRSPLRDSNSDAAWLDRRCHRSMYSYQFKTALQVALDNPQEAVTYVSYACSGGVTDNIVKKWQKPHENMPKNSVLKTGKQYKRVRPQLDVLKDTIGTRQIDFLLLSTGGNDIGFAGYAAYVLTSGTLLRVAGKKPGVNTIDNIYQLSDSYKTLHQSLLQKVNVLGCNPNEPCARILLTPYPDVFNDRNGNLCRADQGEFLYPFKEDLGREARIKRLKHIVFNPLREIQENASNISLNEKEVLRSEAERSLGWTIVKGHFNEYLRHGFCAQSDAEKNAKEFFMPEYKNGQWIYFNPWDYRAYKSRPRWIRLPVDSKLTTDQVRIWWKFTFDLFLIDDRSNVMHPTAEGHAANADANFWEIKAIDEKESL
jgi:hypothetical protein